MIQRVFHLKRAIARALGFNDIERIIEIQQWSSVLWVRLKSSRSIWKSICRFVSYRAVQSLPTQSGEHYMIEGDRRLRVEVDLVSSGELSSFIVRSIEKSPRVWEFHALNGKLTRAFDWNGDLVPREVLRGIAFEVIEKTRSNWVDLALDATRKLRIKSEREVMI